MIEVGNTFYMISLLFVKNMKLYIKCVLVRLFNKLVWLEEKSDTCRDMVSVHYLKCKITIFKKKLWVEALIAFHARRVQFKKIQMSSYEWWNGRKSKLDFVKVLLTLWVKLGPRILKKKKKRKKKDEDVFLWLTPIKQSNSW